MTRKFLAAILSLAAGAQWLGGGTSMPLSLDRLVNDAQLVLRGTVRAKNCQLDPEGRIYTKIDLEVTEVWKGSLTNRSFTVVHSGGVFGNRRSSAAHQVEFQLDEEVVVFLTVNRRGEGVCLGMSQGKFHVWENAAARQKFVSNPFHGGSASDAPAVTPQAKIKNGPLTLVELKQLVRGGGR
ncbi:MAG: hypothetical protein HY043_14665 [Verrucomicrobia bacterium]|nr:hypothetical protein [Verrucomicrobiota bacterium]